MVKELGILQFVVWFFFFIKKTNPKRNKIEEGMQLQKCLL